MTSEVRISGVGVRRCERSRGRYGVGGRSGSGQGESLYGTALPNNAAEERRRVRTVGVRVSRRCFLG